MSLWETGCPAIDAATERHIEAQRQAEIDAAYYSPEPPPDADDAYMEWADAMGQELAAQDA